MEKINGLMVKKRFLHRIKSVNFGVMWLHLGIQMYTNWTHIKNQSGYVQNSIYRDGIVNVVPCKNLNINFLI